MLRCFRTREIQMFIEPSSQKAGREFFRFHFRVYVLAKSRVVYHGERKPNNKPKVLKVSIERPKTRKMKKKENLAGEDLNVLGGGVQKKEPRQDS